MDLATLGPNNDHNRDKEDGDNFRNNDDDSDVEMIRKKPRYKKNQRIYAKDNAGSKYYYSATIKQVRWNNDGGARYKVHYSGWNDRWDQWLMEDKILEESDQNRRFLEVSNLLGGQIKKDEDETPASTSTVTKGKRKRDEDPSMVRKRRGGNNMLSVKSIYEDFCELPFTLKTVLMDECEKITRTQPYSCASNSQPTAKAPGRLVHHLPATVTIQQVLKHFCKKQIQQIKDSHNNPTTSSNHGKEGPAKGKASVLSSSLLTASLSTDVNLSASDVEEFCNGLSELFEAALPKFLLYPQERPQYNALIFSMAGVAHHGPNSRNNNNDKDNLSKKRLTEIYGCEYLLRLFVRLPVLMQSESANNIKLVGPLLAELLVLLQKNRQACFKGNYREPRPEDEWLEVETCSFGGLAMGRNKVDMELGD